MLARNTAAAAVAAGGGGGVGGGAAGGSTAQQPATAISSPRVVFLPPVRLAVPHKQARATLFKRYDKSSKGALSLAECDMVVLDLWPALTYASHRQPMILRAHDALKRHPQPGLVLPLQFARLLHHIVFFNSNWQIFTELTRRLPSASSATAAGASGDGDDGERRTMAVKLDSSSSFKAVCRLLTIEISAAEAEEEFAKLRSGKGTAATGEGAVEVEATVEVEAFCSWAAQENYKAVVALSKAVTAR